MTHARNPIEVERERASIIGRLAETFSVARAAAPAERPGGCCLHLPHLVRTRGISTSFWLGDQIRDWTIALGSWRDLPLTGTPSTVGGTSLGPIYYWTLRVIRHAIGPWTNNLPHAGGIGLSIIQSAADAVLLVAIWKKTGLAWLALAVTLIVATEPIDMALSATIWNPPLAVALVKATIALILLAGDRRSMWWVVGTTTTGWLAVQAHSSAPFVAAPAIASFPLRELLARLWIAAAQQARAAVEVVAVLQLPFVLNLLLHPSGGAGPHGSSWVKVASRSRCS